MAPPETAILASATRVVNRPVARSLPRSTRPVVAVTCAASAGVHLGLVGEHYEEGGLVLATAFVVSAVLLALAALAVTRPGRWSDAGVVVVLLGVAAAYVMSRTTGLPPLIEGREALDVLGTVTTYAEVAAALAVGWPLRNREEQR